MGMCMCMGMFFMPCIMHWANAGAHPVSVHLFFSSPLPPLLFFLPFTSLSSLPFLFNTARPSSGPAPASARSGSGSGPCPSQLRPSSSFRSFWFWFWSRPGQAQLSSGPASSVWRRTPAWPKPCRSRQLRHFWNTVGQAVNEEPSDCSVFETRWAKPWMKSPSDCHFLDDNLPHVACGLLPNP